MRRRDVSSVLPGVRLLPDDRGNVVIGTEDLVEQQAAAVDLAVVEMNPYRALRRVQEFSDLTEAVPHHRQPHRVLQVVLVALERLAGVERRVEVDELHLADELARELRQPRKASQGVESVAADEQVVPSAAPVGLRLPEGASVVEQPDLSDAVVRRRHPLIAAVLVREKG